MELTLQPTAQPTVEAILYDFRVLRQSPRVCKLLKNLTVLPCQGRGCGFELRRPRHSSAVTYGWLALILTASISSIPHTFKTRFLSQPRARQRCRIANRANLASAIELTACDGACALFLEALAQETSLQLGGREQAVETPHRNQSRFSSSKCELMVVRPAWEAAGGLAGGLNSLLGLQRLKEKPK